MYSSLRSASCIVILGMSLLAGCNNSTKSDLQNNGDRMTTNTPDKTLHDLTPLKEISIDVIKNQIINNATPQIIKSISRLLPPEDIREIESKIGNVGAENIEIGSVLRVKSTIENTTENLSYIRNGIIKDLQSKNLKISVEELDRLTNQAMIEAGDYYRIPIHIKNLGYLGSILVSAYDTDSAGSGRAYYIDFNKIQKEDPVIKTISQYSDDKSQDLVTTKGFSFESAGGPVFKTKNGYMDIYNKKSYVSKSVLSSSSISSVPNGIYGVTINIIDGNLVPIVSTDIKLGGAE